MGFWVLVLELAGGREEGWLGKRRYVAAREGDGVWALSIPIPCASGLSGGKDG